MAGADLLKTPTGTAVAQLSEAGLGMLGAKEGKGMCVWSVVVLVVLSSRMSAGGCSLAGRRDNVPCLAITAKESTLTMFGSGLYVGDYERELLAPF